MNTPKERFKVIGDYSAPYWFVEEIEKNKWLIGIEMNDGDALYVEGIIFDNIENAKSYINDVSIVFSHFEG